MTVMRSDHGMITVDKQMRERDPLDHYPSPQALADRAVRELLRPPFAHRPVVIDPGAGTGVWGEAIGKRWGEAEIYGIECDPKYPAHPFYDDWYVRDYLDPALRTTGTLEIVVGNPPYGLAEEFVRRSLSLLHETGQLLFLLRLGFLASQGRGRGLFVEHPPTRVHVCVSRPSFTGDGKTDATEYAMFYWDLARHGAPTQLRWWDWRKQDSGQSELGL
jgi:hypothetical protein